MIESTIKVEASFDEKMKIAQNNTFEEMRLVHESKSAGVSEGAKRNCIDRSNRT